MPALLRLKQVTQHLGLGRTCIYDNIKKGLLPPPIKYGENISLWPADEIEECSRAIIKSWTPAEMRQLVQEQVARRATA